MFGVVAGLIFIGAIVSNVLSIRAARAELQARADVATAEAVTRFLKDDLLGQANPLQSPDRDLQLRSVLDHAANRVGDQFRGQPEVEARLRLTLAHSYLALGKFPAAEIQLQRCWELVAASPERPSLPTGKLTAAIDRIVKSYEANGNEEQAQVWRAKLPAE